MSEINVTPMVGVVLVLLIIFMVMAPWLTVGIDIGDNAPLSDVASPNTEAGPVTPGSSLSIAVGTDGKITLQNTEIAFDDLAPHLAGLREAGGVSRVWLRGDKGAAYGDVARVLVQVREAGLPVTLLTDQAGPR